MRYLVILITTLIPFSSFAGTGGGGVGPRPMSSFVSDADWVRSVSTDNETITFLYQPFEEKFPKIYTRRLIDVDKAYLDALTDSGRQKQWIPVPIPR